MYGGEPPVPAEDGREAPAVAAAAVGSSGSSSGFPVTPGEAFALRFGQVSLNFSPGAAKQRAKQLAAFIPANVRGTDPQFGWSGVGTARLQGVQVAGIEVRSAQTAVTLLATVNDRLLELGMPLYAKGGGIAVSGEPARLPAPPAARPPENPATDSDSSAKNALSSQLPNFFQAYAGGDRATLNRYLMPGVSITGLGGAVSFGSIGALVVPPGPRHHGDGGLDASRADRPGGTATRHDLRHGGRRPAKRKMVCKGHPCIYAADGDLMTRASEPPPVPKRPRKLTDVHGREG